MTSTQYGLWEGHAEGYGILVAPNSWSNTVSFFDLQTLTEIARFRTSPDIISGYNWTGGYASPSRTCFDHDGNVWVANRGVNTVVKIGINNYRSDIPSSHTSTGPNDVKYWGQDSRVLMEYHLMHDGLTEARLPAVCCTGDINLICGTGLSVVGVDPDPDTEYNATRDENNLFTCFVSKNIRHRIRLYNSYSPGVFHVAHNKTDTFVDINPYQSYDITSWIDSDEDLIFYMTATNVPDEKLYCLQLGFYDNFYSGTNMGLRGMACDSNGNMWVGSYYNKYGQEHAVFWKIDAKTDAITQYVPDIDGQAYGAVYNSTYNRIYFSPTTNKTLNVIELDPSTGTFQGLTSQVSARYSYGLAMDSYGNMYRPSPVYTNGWGYTCWHTWKDVNDNYMGEGWPAFNHPIYSCCTMHGGNCDYLYILNADANNNGVLLEVCKIEPMYFTRSYYPRIQTNVTKVQTYTLPHTYSYAYHGIASDPVNSYTIWAMPYNTNSPSIANKVLRIRTNEDGTVKDTTWFDCGSTCHYNYSDFTGYYGTYD